MYVPPSFAAIGTTTPEKYPAEWVILFRRAVRHAVRCNLELRTGAAIGYDQIGAEEVLGAGGKVCLVLPWPNYERDWQTEITTANPGRVRMVVYDPAKHGDWTASVEKYHPAPHRLDSQGKFKLIARDYGIVYPARLVLAAPSAKPGKGGTGQGLRAARDLGIPVFDLSEAPDRDRLTKILEKAGA